MVYRPEFHINLEKNISFMNLNPTVNTIECLLGLLLYFMC